MRHTTAIIAMIALLLTGCGNSTYHGKLDAIDSLIAHQDEKALTALDSLAPYQEDFTRGENMRYHFLLADAHNQFFVPMTADTFMTDVAEYYEDKGSEQQQVKALYLLGCVYRDRNDAPQAIEYYHRAISRADTTKNDCDYFQLCRVYAQMADIFSEQRVPALEIQMWQKAIKYAEMAKDTLSAINYLEHSSGAYYMLGQKEKAYEICKETYKRYKDFGYSDWAAASLSLIIDYELNTKKLDKVKQHIDEYTYKSGVFIRKTSFHNYYNARYYEIIGKRDSSASYYYKLLENTNRISNLENGYRGLMNYYQYRNLPDSVTKYTTLFADANDSASFNNSMAEIVRMQAQYNYNAQQLIAKEKAEESARLQKIIYCICLGFGLTLLAVYFYVRKARKRQKENQMATNREYTSLLFRHRELTGELASLHTDIALYKNDKEEEISLLQRQLNAFRETEYKVGEWNQEEALLSHQTVRRFHELSSRIAVPSESEWSDLFEITAQNIPDFYEVLMNADLLLTDKELKTGLLIRLYFIPSEIAILLNVTKQRVTNLRGTLNKKLFNTEGTNGLDKRIRSI